MRGGEIFPPAHTHLDTNARGRILPPAQKLVKDRGLLRVLRPPSLIGINPPSRVYISCAGPLLLFPHTLQSRDDYGKHSSLSLRFAAEFSLIAGERFYPSGCGGHKNSENVATFSEFLGGRKNLSPAHNPGYVGS